MVCTPNKSDNSRVENKYQKMKEKYTPRHCKLSLDMKALSIFIANDMSASDLRRHQLEAEKNVNRLRNCMPEKLTAFCKTHLSSLLELDGPQLEEMFLEQAADIKRKKKRNATPFSTKKKERMSSTSGQLTKEIVSQLCILIEFLHKPDNLKTEGLFRKTGNVTRQRLLKECVIQGADLHLDDATFSTHDVATVLKQLVGDLPEPILTDKHYKAHLHIVDMVRNTQTEKEMTKAKGKQLKALQLMSLLLPRENAIFLECLLDLLHRVASVAENKMSASSLGVVFAPSLLCPRKLTPEEMQSVSPILSKAVTTLIDNAPSVFTVPKELGDDVANFWREMEDPDILVLDEELSMENLDDEANIQKTKKHHSPAVHVVDLGASPCNVRPKKRLSDVNTQRQVKDAKNKHIENNNFNNSTPCKVLFLGTPVTGRSVAMISPITKCVANMGALSKKAMMTPRSRLTMLITQSPSTSFKESCL